MEAMTSPAGKPNRKVIPAIKPGVHNLMGGVEGIDD
jgi:hypothetical protein